MAGGRMFEIERGVEVEVPQGWESDEDEDEGILLSSEEGPGLLHLVAFADPAEEPSDPAEELYAFLEDQGVELKEDEVEDMELEGGAELAYCEYVSEDGEEEDEPATYWLVGIATGPGRLVFGSYTCPAGEQEAERATIVSILSSLKLRI